MLIYADRQNVQYYMSVKQCKCTVTNITLQLTNDSAFAGLNTQLHRNTAEH